MSTLFIIGTPIGNLEDITLRALKVLKNVDFVACEDTRRTGLLLNHFQINKKLVSYHQHSRLQKIEYLISELRAGKSIALVTDAGTPGIADPAGVLIAKALESKIKVEPIPGPSVLPTFLSVVGADTSRFLFLGFLPKKKGRAAIFRLIAQSEFPVVFLESPNRVIKTLNDLAKIDIKEIVVGRELTKKFEEIYRGEIDEVLKYIRPQGEFVVFVPGKK